MGSKDLKIESAEVHSELGIGGHESVGGWVWGARKGSWGSRFVFGGLRHGG